MIPLVLTNVLSISKRSLFLVQSMPTWALPIKAALNVLMERVARREVVLQSFEFCLYYTGLT